MQYAWAGFSCWRAFSRADLLARCLRADWLWEEGSEMQACDTCQPAVIWERSLLFHAIPLWEESPEDASLRILFALSFVPAMLFWL